MTATDPGSQLSDAELRGMTQDLDALHHDLTLPALKDSLGEWADEIRGGAAAVSSAGAPQPGLDRRRFLIGTGGVAAGVTLIAACGSSAPSSSGSSPSSSPQAMTGGEGQDLTGDLRVVGMAASLENSGVATYSSALKAANAGKLGTVPPAVVTFVKTAMRQHQDHQKAWNAVLTSAGKQPVTAVDPVLQPTINKAFSSVTNVTQLADLALLVENTAGQTYQNGLAVIKSPAGIKTAASIQPVEFQHAAILYFILGKYPVPNAFTGTSLARPPSDYRT